MRRGCAGCHQICILPHVWMSDLPDLCRGLPVPKRNSHSTTCLCVRNARSPQTVAAAKKFRISPHHMFAHPTRTISAEGCTRTSKTRISPHVWVSDTSDFAGVQMQFDHLEAELLCSNSCVTISVQMTLQAGVLQEFR